jgi:hypothetical protein
MPKVLVALPISKDLKRYYWNKYQYLREHNGPKFASEVFSTLREFVMEYIDCAPYGVGYEGFLNDWEIARGTKLPVRKNGWFKKLLDYAKTDPLSVLQFLKLYTSEAEPVVTVTEAAEKQTAILESANECGLPSTLYAWMTFVSYPAGIWRKELKLFQQGKITPKKSFVLFYKGGNYLIPGADSTNSADKALYRLLTGVVYPVLQANPEYVYKYVKGWQARLKPTWLSEDRYKKAINQALPTTRSYSSTSYGAKVPDDCSLLDIEEDMWGLGAAMQTWDYLPTLYEGTLPDGIYDYLDSVNGPVDDETGDDQLIVGHIRHIPKKGTVKRRSIAAPNRFLQAGTAPCRLILRSISQKLPRNCMFDQSRMDHVIRNHLENGYAGSVDLSQATDWLPLSWLTTAAELFNWFGSIQTYRDPISDMETWSYEGNATLTGFLSWRLFLDISRASWENEADTVRWKRGQPLGSWPSFEALTITHTIVCEALALHNRRWDEPYALLGDDVVFFDEATRKAYIHMMNMIGSPLSLQKSFAGRMTEFAGKIFIFNQPTKFCPVAQPIYWANLFDYQRCAQVNIDFDDLPHAVKERFKRCVSKYLIDSDHATLRECYKALQAIVGIPVTQLSNLSGQFIINYYSNVDKREEPDVIEDHGFFLIEDHVFHYEERLTPVAPKHRKMQKWFQDKVRPQTTDKLIEFSCRDLDLQIYVSEALGRL